MFNSSRSKLFLGVIISLLFLLLLTYIDIATADTEVGGPIVADTTWTLSNSPYIVVANVEVWEDVTLTIEPGVVVKFKNGTKLQVNGTLIAQGTGSQFITFTSNQTNPQPSDWGNLEFTETYVPTSMDANGNYISGSILKYCVVEYGGAAVDSVIDTHSLLIDRCIVRRNQARAIFNPGTQSFSSRISNNTVNYNVAAKSGAGIYGEYATIHNNIVSNNYLTTPETGGGIFAENSTVSNNVVINNYGHNGGGVYAEYSTLEDNFVSENIAYFGGGVYARFSTLNNNIVTSNIATTSLFGSNTPRGGGLHVEYSVLTDNVISNNVISGLSAQGGGIWGWGCTINGNVFSGNKAIATALARGGGMILYVNSIANNNVVINNKAIATGFLGGEGGAAGGGIFGSSVTLFSNVVSSNLVSGTVYAYGGGIYAVETNSVLTNTITNNNLSASDDVMGIGMYLESSGDVLYNTIIGNTGPQTALIGGVDFNGTPNVHYNNFYGNIPYDVVVLSSPDINGTNNYWGTASSVEILTQVYDWYDDTDRGKFLYVPYLEGQYPNTPLPPPLGLDADFQEESVTLSWDTPPGFTNGWGYKVYYDSDSVDPPYDGIGLDQGNSPIDIGTQTTFTFNGLNFNQDYYFTVTVYDGHEHESWYSSVVLRESNNVFLPVTLRR
jgi:hypothetical protein